METGDDPDISVHKWGVHRGIRSELVPVMDFRYGEIVLLKGQSSGFSFLVQLSLWKACETQMEILVLQFSFLSVINPADILQKMGCTKSIKIIKYKQNHKQTGKNVCDSQTHLCISFYNLRFFLSHTSFQDASQILTQYITALTNTDAWKGTKHDDVEGHLETQVCVLEVLAASLHCHRRDVGRTLACCLE